MKALDKLTNRHFGLLYSNFKQFIKLLLSSFLLLFLLLYFFQNLKKKKKILKTRLRAISIRRRNLDQYNQLLIAEINITE